MSAATKEHLTIKGIPLMKFQTCERIESLQHGYLYAKPLDYYRKLEEITGDATVGDRREGMLPIHEGYVRFSDQVPFTPLRDGLIPTKHSGDFVFCSFGIDTRIEGFSFSNDQMEKMKTFGDTCLIILDSTEFLRRIDNAAEALGYRSFHHGVAYYDSSIDNGNMFISLMQDMRNIAFWKRDTYAYQQEYRILFTPPEGVRSHGDHLDLFIGDISDISAIKPADSVLRGFLAKQ